MADIEDKALNAYLSAILLKIHPVTATKGELQSHAAGWSITPSRKMEQVERPAESCKNLFDTTGRTA